MSGRDRGDRPKKSWREMDAMRDRAGPRKPREEPARPGEAMDARASKQYRAALDALFAKGEVGKLADKLSGPVARIDPHDIVRGTHRGGGNDGPVMSGASSSGGSGTGGSSTGGSGAGASSSSSAT